MTLRGFFARLAPLSLSDVVMALGDPLQVMALTRLADPTTSLATMGVVKAIANLLESPVIVMLHASTALAKRAESRAALWRFMLALSSTLTLIFMLLCLPGIYSRLLQDVFGVGPAVTDAARIPFLIMVAWPAIIAWRRYYQGLLIDGSSGHCLGLASGGRILTVVTILVCGVALRGDGPIVAALALIGGVLAEALLITLFARGRVACDPVQADTPPLPSTMSEVARFYAPLATSMLLVWGGRAALVALIARTEGGTLALAGWLAGWGLVLLIANATRMVQQITISTWRTVGTLRLLGFSSVAGGLCCSLLVLLGWSAAGQRILFFLWGGDPEVCRLALQVIQIGAVLPCLVATQNVLQGVCIAKGRPGIVQNATVAGVIAVLLSALLLSSAAVPGALMGSVSVIFGLVIEIGALTAGARYARSAGSAS